MLLSTLLFAAASSLIADAAESAAVDCVDLPYGQFQGYTNQTSNLTYFLGMPYAAAPVGPLRFNVPHPPPYLSVRNATGYGAACIQQSPPSPPGVPPLAGSFLSTPSENQSEDCLFVNVIRPSNIPPSTQLPIVFWIYGGGFETGDSAQTDGAPIVERSIALGDPVIYVSANYRLNAYGFLASQEVKAAGVGNLGLRDQRYALEWVQRNIHLFGGDKEKVTIWGESAGAISVGFHLVANGGNPDGMFRGAFMNSGSPYSASDIIAGQRYYDLLVEETGCSNASNTLECLRSIAQENITEIVVTKMPNILSFQSIQFAYGPLVDGDSVKENPQDSIAKGAYAKVPFVIGDCYDEGTLFSTNQNLNTSTEFLDYVHRNYFPNASTADIEEIGRLYPDDPAQGSPFGTGNSTSAYPQFKRLAAFTGDLVFQSARRYLLQAASKTQDVWAFNYRRSDTGAGRLEAIVGSHHTVDALSFGFAGLTHDSQGMDALLNFVNHLNPIGTGSQNSSLSSVEWPTWDNSSRSALTFWDPTVLNITSDTEREESINGLITLLRNFPMGYSDLPISASPGPV